MENFNFSQVRFCKYLIYPHVGTGSSPENIQLIYPLYMLMQTPLTIGGSFANLKAATSKRETIR